MLLFLLSQFVEDPRFDRHGLTLVEVLQQAMSGLDYLHSLNIGTINYYELRER